MSFYTTSGRLFKRVTGVRDISLMRKKMRKRVGQLLYHKRYTTAEVIGIMQEMGMSRGSVVCIHAAMREFYNFQGTAEQLIDAILEVIGDEGTLMMPAFPDPALRQCEGYIFDPAHDPTAAGYLAETFRKHSGVKRSINVQHSVCAWGRHADWLTRDHHRCDNCWGVDSPWYRMTTLGALVFTLGMPDFYIGTFDHCVEGLLYKENPYWAQFLAKTETYHYYKEDGSVGEYTCQTGDIERRERENRLTRHFDKNIFRKRQVSNLHIKVFHARPCLEKMIELGRRGITMYYVPSPKKYRHCFER